MSICLKTFQLHNIMVDEIIIYFPYYYANVAELKIVLVQ